ncbi:MULTISPECIES: PRC-barrel domain-containing protein [unclassified Streptomyces]|uniref:PRC-barrel domain-containing protein n=1 Tax=unclassified Streptomyces TaxID=2593676 RepID=UPI001E62A5BA|nr:PRC-barrel domain-containing protein [Streptomyces sp. MNU76]MCC9711910.1 PRC-barrel domain-containing protein [Streptomyces sp. MNU76]
MPLFSQAKGRDIVGLSTAETLATVTGLAITVSPARIAALRVKTKNPGTLVTWNHVQAFGPDAITVRSADDIQTEDDTKTPADKKHDPLGKRVLTETGHDLGTLQDIEFDETTGHIQRLILAGQDVEGERLLGAGSYAVIVATP